jgi:hypothetical protein
MLRKSWLDAGVYFEKDGGDGGSGGGNGDDSGKKSDDKLADEKKFSQADVDRIMGEVRDGGRKVGVNDLLKELGFEKTDDLKALVADAKKLREQQMSDLEKAQTAVKEAQAKIEQAERERTEAIAKAQETLMRAAVLAEASKPEYHFKAEALQDVWSFIKRESIKPKDGADGEFTGIGEALKALAKEKTYLVAEGDGRGTPRPGQRKLGDQKKEEPRKGFTL